ncbi:ABC transporter substrate-binding protein [Bauldia sp.]|uniref:ABC transporter substrate-binding protein n=1 Tax=Bauldia sp. TaxID=2575872 RepID=UPI003BAB03A5
MPSFFRAVAFFVTLIAISAAANAEPKRIVSINLCADELLIALADPNQIAALSIYATNERMAFFADRAKAFRHDAGDAETVVELDPDLVVAGRFTKRASRDMLSALGYEVALLEPARSIDESIDQIRRVANLVGHPDRGEVLVAEIEAARERARSAIADGAAPSAVVYQRRGYVTGGDTLTGELLEMVGVTNAGGALAGGTGGLVPLEVMIANPPDYLVVAATNRAADDQGAALLAHPALELLFPVERRIVLPERLTVCGGPSLPTALDRLSAELRRVHGSS